MYFNSSLNLSLSIDHYFISMNLKILFRKLLVCDSLANLSDCRPLIGFFDINLPIWPGSAINQLESEAKHYVWCGDKSELDQYCLESYYELMNIAVPSDCINGQPDCTNLAHSAQIDIFYDNIVQGLHNATIKTVHRTPCNALKAFWNDELDK